MLPAGSLLSCTSFSVSHCVYSVVDIAVENLESFDDTAIAEGQESGSAPAKKQVGHETEPPLHYSFSMSHYCIASDIKLYMYAPPLPLHPIEVLY